MHMKVLFFYRGAESFGIEYLSAVLKEAGHQTELLFDPGLDNNFYVSAPWLQGLGSIRRLMRQAREFGPDLVAFSCITNLYPYVKRVARALKAELSVPTVIGGIHPTVLPEFVLREDCFDIACLGEGEYALLELANRMEAEEDITQIPNLWVKDKDGVIHRNHLRPLIQDLDSLPFPDKDLFYRKGAFWRNVSLMTGRGCPFHCTFCINSFYHRTNVRRERLVRRRGVASVIEELKLYKRKYLPRSVNLQDDTFSLDTKWLAEFARRYAAEIGIPFQCNMHPTTVSESSIRLLKKAGCRSICLGIQCGDPGLRKNVLRRTGTNEQIIEACQRIKGSGIHLVTEYIFGLPHETPETMWESVALNRRLRPDNTSTFVFYPFPGTELAERCRTEGLLGEKAAAKVAEGFGSYHTTLLIDHPYRDYAQNMAALLPLASKLPPPIGDRLLGKLCTRKHGALIRWLRVLGVPFMNTWQARERIQDMVYMIWRSLFRVGSAAPQAHAREGD